MDGSIAGWLVGLIRPSDRADLMTIYAKRPRDGGRSRRFRLARASSSSHLLYLRAPAKLSRRFVGIFTLVLTRRRPICRRIAAFSPSLPLCTRRAFVAPSRRFPAPAPPVPTRETRPTTGYRRRGAATSRARRGRFRRLWHPYRRAAVAPRAGGSLYLLPMWCWAGLLADSGTIDLLPVISPVARRVQEPGANFRLRRGGDQRCPPRMRRFISRRTGSIDGSVSGTPLLARSRRAGGVTSRTISSRTSQRTRCRTCPP